MTNEITVSDEVRFGTFTMAARRYGQSIRTLQRRAAEGAVVVVRLGDRPLVDYRATDAKLIRANAV